MDANITDVEIAINNITSVEDISDAMTCWIIMADKVQIIKQIS